MMTVPFAVPAVSAVEVYKPVELVSTEEALLAALALREEHTEEALATIGQSNDVSDYSNEEFHDVDQHDYCHVVGSNSYYSYFFLNIHHTCKPDRYFPIPYI